MRLNALDNLRRGVGLSVLTFALALPAPVSAQSPTDAQYDDAAQDVIESVEAAREAGGGVAEGAATGGGAAGESEPASGARLRVGTGTDDAPSTALEVGRDRDDGRLPFSGLLSDQPWVGWLLAAPAIIALGAAIAFLLGRRDSI